MASSHNCHRLLSTGSGYLHAIKVPDQDLTALRGARELIRQTLRNAFGNFRQFVEARELFGDTLTESALQKQSLPTPKFRVQGSFDYHTANVCQQSPPQQIDQDDGLFLPVSFVMQGGAASARVSSRGFFTLVENALQPICTQKGWTLNPGGKKSSCVRVEISGRLHIDVPLYAIKDVQYHQLVEKAVRADSLRAMAMDSDELASDVFFEIPDEDILLAHRDDHWIGSDPRKLGRWFEQVIDVYGEQIRRMARAYKGLRDAHWKAPELGSIAIMAVMVDARERCGTGFDDSRDDLALLRVGREMVKLLKQPIYNPAFPGEEEKLLCKDWTLEFRGEVASVFDRACDELDAAINNSASKAEAHVHLRNAFGPWVPNDPDLIMTIGSAAIIRSTEPDPQSRPLVPRTKSG